MKTACWSAIQLKNRTVYIPNELRDDYESYISKAFQGSFPNIENLDAECSSVWIKDSSGKWSPRIITQRWLQMFVGDDNTEALATTFYRLLHDNLTMPFTERDFPFVVAAWMESFGSDEAFIDALARAMSNPGEFFEQAERIRDISFSLIAEVELSLSEFLSNNRSSLLKFTVDARFVVPPSWHTGKLSWVIVNGIDGFSLSQNTLFLNMPKRYLLEGPAVGQDIMPAYVFRVGSSCCSSKIARAIIKALKLQARTYEGFFTCTDSDDDQKAKIDILTEVFEPVLEDVVDQNTAGHVEFVLPPYEVAHQKVLAFAKGRDLSSYKYTRELQGLSMVLLYASEACSSCPFDDGFEEQNNNGLERSEDINGTKQTS